MAQSKLSIYNKQKDLECTICLSDFIEPKLLACLHTFCMTCLKRYCEEIDEEEKPCPLCRTEFIVPEGGVEMLKTDQVKARLVLEKKTQEAKQKIPKCEIGLCEDASAEAYCLECLRNLCLSCKKAHLKFNFEKFHKIVGIDEKPCEQELQKVKSQFCTTHVGKQIELYCCDCEKLLCYSCHATEHNKHLCKVPSEVAKSKCNEFIEDQYRVRRCLEHEIGKVNDMKAEPMTHLKEIIKIEKVVEDSFAIMANHLEEQKSKLLTSLKEIKKEKLKTVESMDYVSEFRCAELNSFLEYSRMMMERGTDYEILAIANELHTRAENLVQSQEKRNEEKGLPIRLKLLADITSMVEKLKRAVLESHLQPTQDWNRLLNNSRVQSFTSGVKSLYGIAIHDNKVYIISIGTPHILVYSLQNLSTVSRQISVPGLTEARGVVYNESDSCLYASNRFPARIYKINKENFVSGWATQTAQPWGLSISKQKKLLVSYISGGQIDEFNGSGKLMRRIKLTDGINGINHSIELGTGAFIVCQWRPLCRICLVDSLGKLIKSYGNECGSAVVQLKDLLHVELDQKGNILVTDYDNNKLRVLTTDLKYVADVNITDTDFKYPTCTCWDKKNDRLLVSTWSGSFYAITPRLL